MRSGPRTQKALSLFNAWGGWRTVAEAVASQALFLIVFLLTDRLMVAALAAVTTVAVLTVARFRADRKYRSALVSLGAVGLSAVLAGRTGTAVGFFLLDVIWQVALAALVLVSMLVRWPLVGVAVGLARGRRFGWRHDPAQRRLYQLCTGVLLAKLCIAAAVLIPLYVAEQVTALGIASILSGAPALAVCGYVCWRVLGTPAGLDELPTG
ncbi:DUF3159 domain-containing protein [Promicromonospora sp. NPDC060271]|uniref:DUF3159 domain-containing protein n=1 Tax=Promicromonospora sp. NPDC060271 TaxID=3347089 RepID=UPI00365A8691